MKEFYFGALSLKSIKIKIKHYQLGFMIEEYKKIHGIKNKQFLRLFLQLSF